MKSADCIKHVTAAGGYLVWVCYCDFADTLTKRGIGFEWTINSDEYRQRHTKPLSFVTHVQPRQQLSKREIDHAAL